MRRIGTQGEKEKRTPKVAGSSPAMSPRHQTRSGAMNEVEIISNILLRFNDANLDSEVAREKIAKEILAALPRNNREQVRRENTDKQFYTASDFRNDAARLLGFPC